MKKPWAMALLFFSVLAFSQSNNEGTGRLKMTPEQKQKNIEIHKKFNNDLSRLKAKQKVQLDRLKERHRKQIERLHKDHENETDRIYNPEQLEKLNEIREKRALQNQKYKSKSVK